MSPCIVGIASGYIYIRRCGVLFIRTWLYQSLLPDKRPILHFLLFVIFVGGVDM